MFNYEYLFHFEILLIDKTFIINVCSSSSALHKSFVASVVIQNKHAVQLCTARCKLIPNILLLLKQYTNKLVSKGFLHLVGMNTRLAHEPAYRPMQAEVF